MTKDIGEFLKEIRKEKGLTQKAIAEQIGVSDKTISKWEQGNSVPDTTMLLPLCEALGITVNELLSCEKIVPENYSVKAEENIMALIKENEITKKNNNVSKIIGGVIVCIALIFTVVSMAGLSFPLMNYLDIPSLVSLGMIEAGIILISNARTKEKVLHLLSKTIVPIGLMITMAAIIIIFINISDASVIRPNLAVAFLAFLYSLAAKVIVELLLVSRKNN